MLKYSVALLQIWTGELAGSMRNPPAEGVMLRV